MYNKGYPLFSNNYIRINNQYFADTLLDIFSKTEIEDKDKTPLP